MIQARLGRGSFHRGLARGLVLAQLLFSVALGLAHHHAGPLASRQEAGHADTCGTGTVTVALTSATPQSSPSPCAVCVVLTTTFARLAAGETGVSAPAARAALHTAQTLSPRRVPSGACHSRAPPCV